MVGMLLGFAGTASANPAADARSTAAPTSHAASHAPSDPSSAPEPPANFDDVAGWVHYRSAIRAAALPLQARVLFRRGLVAHETGNLPQALRLVRGAAQLDPTFLAARWSLFTWQVFRDPTQAGVEASEMVELVRRDFVTQWSLASNALALLVQTWVLALLTVGLLVLLAHQDELRHAWYERLARWSPGPSSIAGSWVLLAAPFVLLGLALPTVAFLMMLWPFFQLRERIAAVLLTLTLATMPYASGVFDRLAIPMRAEDQPIAALIPLQDDPRSESLRGNLETVARRASDNPYAQFGLGWTDQHAGNWTDAEVAYRRVLTKWPDDDHALDNLGSVLAHQGRRDEAVKSFEQATAKNPKNAIAFFNLAQAHTQGYEFEAASQAMATASKLDFDAVRDYKDQPARAGGLDPVPDWLSPRRQWGALLTLGPLGGEHLPAAWRAFPEVTSRRYATFVMVAALIGLVLGWLLQRGLPLHRCRNCNRVVCRRCSERRRAQNLCRPCSRVAGGAASPDFARILLARQKQRSTRVVNALRSALGWIIPGAGLVLLGRLGRTFMLQLVLMGTLSVLAMSRWPYAGRPRVGWDGGTLPWAGLAAVVLVYLVSLVWTSAELRRVARANSAERVLRPRPERGAAGESHTPEQAA